MRRFLSVFKINKESRRFKFIEGIIETEKVSVLGVIKYLLSFIRVIVLLPVIFGVVGLIFFGESPKYYTTTSVVIPDGGAPPNPNLQDLGDILGAPSLPSSSSLGIESFPGIIENTVFMKKLIQKNIYSERFGEMLPIGEYLERISPPPSKISLLKARLTQIPVNIIESLKPEEIGTQRESRKEVIYKDSLPTLSDRENKLIGLLQGKIEIGGSATISITTNFPEAKITSRFNQLLINELEEEVTRIRNGKRLRDLRLLEQKLDSTKIQFEDAQIALAEYLDRNKGVQTAQYRIEYDKLQSDYNLYLGIYSSLEQEVASTKVELVVNTPFYEVYEPPYVPKYPVGGYSIGPAIKYAVIGVLLGVFWSFIYTVIVILSIFRSKLNSLNI